MADGDVTDTESIQQALVRERDRLHLLLEINNAVVSHLGLRELLKEISACLRRLIPHDLAGLALYDPESCQLRAHVLDFPGKQDFVESGTVIPWEGTPEGLALPVANASYQLPSFSSRSGQSVICSSSRYIANGRSVLS